MNNLIVGRALRTFLFSMAVVFASGELPRAHQQADGELGPTGELRDATVVVRWSQLAQDNAFAIDPAMTDPFPNARGWTMMYLAMHDALNAIVPTFQQYAFFGTDRSAHPIAAAAQAARDVMNHIYPDASGGERRGARLLARPDPGRPPQDPGHRARRRERSRDHRCTCERQHARARRVRACRILSSPATTVSFHRWSSSTGLRSATRSHSRIGAGAEFLPAPPPALTSWDYALSVAETKAFGRLNSTFRSQDQTNFGAWWLEFNEIQWGRIMRQLTETRGLRLLEAVRMFALANMANIDATVAVWYAKNHYDFWRPFHAIRLAGTDGNPFTEADPNWVSEHIVPPLQEYPSAHAIQCQAIARTLQIRLRDRPRQLRNPVDHRAPGESGSLVHAVERCLEGMQRIAHHGGVPLPLLSECRSPHGQQHRQKIVDTQLRRR